MCRCCGRLASAGYAPPPLVRLRQLWRLWSLRFCGRCAARGGVLAAGGGSCRPCRCRALWAFCLPRCFFLLSGFGCCPQPVRVRADLLGVGCQAFGVVARGGSAACCSWFGAVLILSGAGSLGVPQQDRRQNISGCTASGFRMLGSLPRLRRCVRSVGASGSGRVVASSACSCCPSARVR